MQAVIDLPGTGLPKLSFDSNSIENKSWLGNFDNLTMEDAAEEARKAKVAAQREKTLRLRAEKAAEMYSPIYSSSYNGLTTAGNSRAKITKASRKLLGRDFMNYMIQAGRIDPAEHKHEAKRCPSWTPAGLGHVASFADRARIKHASERHRRRVRETRNRHEQYRKHIRIKGPPEKVYAGLLKSTSHGADCEKVNVDIVRKVLRTSKDKKNDAIYTRRSKEEKPRISQQRFKPQVPGWIEKQQPSRSANLRKPQTLQFDEEDDLNSWGDKSYEVAEQFIAHSSNKWAVHIEKNAALYPAAFIRPAPFIHDESSCDNSADGRISPGAGSLGDMYWPHGEPQERLLEVSAALISPIAAAPRPGTGSNVGGKTRARSRSRPGTAPSFLKKRQSP